MKYPVRDLVVTLLVVCLIVPLGVVAQITQNSDGSNEPETVRRERIGNYRRQSSELQRKISALPSVANAMVYMPVLFGVGRQNISPNFGDPRSDNRTHKGEDIMAVSGTPIISPTAAVVLRTGVGETEGNYVYTANPGGETFVYMHLDRIGEGVVSETVLQQGSLIGYVGNTGNASGGAAHLHFEIHDSSNIAVDPYPRLTGELSLQEKITYLFTILTQTSNSGALSQFLVTNFRSTFTSALAANISLPPSITNALATVPVSTSPTNPRVTLPAGDLDIGSSGNAVVTLQNYVIQSASGPAAQTLAGATATGYFGAITKAAVLEFQIAKNISPANGYYGLSTQLFIANHPLVGVMPQPSPLSTVSLQLSRNLSLGMSGEDIRALQKKLNALGYTVAQSGLGSSGNETNYFGPATVAAVIKFQAAQNISPAAGYVGPLTRASLSKF